MTGVKPLGIHAGQGRKVLDTVLRKPYPDAAVLILLRRLHLQHKGVAGQGIIQRLSLPDAHLQIQSGGGVVRLMGVTEELREILRFQLSQGLIPAVEEGEEQAFLFSCEGTFGVIGIDHGPGALQHQDSGV